MLAAMPTAGSVEARSLQPADPASPSNPPHPDQPALVIGGGDGASTSRSEGPVPTGSLGKRSFTSVSAAAPDSQLTARSSSAVFVIRPPSNSGRPPRAPSQPRYPLNSSLNSSSLSQQSASQSSNSGSYNGSVGAPTGRSQLSGSASGGGTTKALHCRTNSLTLHVDEALTCAICCHVFLEPVMLETGQTYCKR